MHYSIVQQRIRTVARGLAAGTGRDPTSGWRRLGGAVRSRVTVLSICPFMCALLVVTPLNGCEGAVGSAWGSQRRTIGGECLGSPHIIALFRLTGTVHENTTLLSTYSDYHSYCRWSVVRTRWCGWLRSTTSRGVRSGERARGERPVGLTCVCFSICVCFTVVRPECVDRSVCLLYGFVPG